MQMQSTFSIPNGSAPGWTPAMQFQPMVQPAQTVHASQIQPAMQPSQTQMMVVHPSNQIQYQLRMNQAGWRNQQLNTAKMTMACQWKSDNKVQTDGDWCRWQQECVRLQQQYQLLHSEYRAALVQIQTLTLHYSELDKKLKIEQWKNQELNNKYMIAIQMEQNKYNVLSNMHTETSNQLCIEQNKCNVLSVELEESTKNLKNEQQKYEELSALHAETKKTLHNMRQKDEEVGKVIDNKSNSASDKGQYDSKHQILSNDGLVKPILIEPHLEHLTVGQRGSLSNIDPTDTTGGDTSTERESHLIIPPGFERCTQLSGQGIAKA